MAQRVQFRASANSGAGDNKACNKPAGVIRRDVMVAMVVHYDNSSSRVTTPPTGWRLAGVATASNGGSITVLEVFWKVAGDAEPASYTFTPSDNGYTNVAISAYSGVDWLDPVGLVTTNSGGGSASTISAVWLGGRMPRNGGMAALVYGGYNKESSSPAGPNGQVMNTRVDALDGVSDFYDTRVDARQTGDFTASIAGDGLSLNFWTAIAVYMQPPAPSILEGILNNFAPGAGGDLALSGTASVDVTVTGNLAANGVLSGAASVPVTATGNATGTGALSGTASVAATVTGNATGTGTLSGTASVSVTATGAPTADGVLSGNADVPVTVTGDMVSGAISGAASVSVTATGNLTADGVLSGAASVPITATGGLAANGALSGASTTPVTAAGGLAANGALSGASTTSVSATGGATGTGAPSGTATVGVTATGGLAANGVLSGTATVSVTATGELGDGSGVLFEAITTSATATVNRPGTQAECEGKTITIVARGSSSTEDFTLSISGFTSAHRQHRDLGSNNHTVLEIFTKPATASEPSTYTVVATGGGSISWGVEALRTTRGEVDVVSGSDAGTPTSGNAVWPGVTVSENGSLAIAAARRFESSFGTPSGFDARATGADSVWTNELDAGATGDITVTLGSGQWLTALLVLKPTSGAIAGTASVSVTVTGNLAANGVLSGTAAVSATVTGGASAPGVLSGTSTTSATVAGGVSAPGVLSGTSAVSATVTGGLRANGVLSGVASVSVTVTGSIMTPPEPGGETAAVLVSVRTEAILAVVTTSAVLGSVVTEADVSPT